MLDPEFVALSASTLKKKCCSSINTRDNRHIHPTEGKTKIFNSQGKQIYSPYTMDSRDIYTTQGKTYIHLTDGKTDIHLTEGKTCIHSTEGKTKLFTLQKGKQRYSPHRRENIYSPFTMENIDINPTPGKHRYSPHTSENLDIHPIEGETEIFEVSIHAILNNHQNPLLENFRNEIVRLNMNILDISEIPRPGGEEKYMDKHRIIFSRKRGCGRGRLQGYEGGIGIDLD